MAPAKCGICVDSASKYKCPICLTPYCSLACYRIHKETPCSKEPKPAAPNQDEQEDLMQQPPRSFENDEDESAWRLRQRQLESLAESNEIRQMLRDDTLQQLIQKVDSSITPEQDLARAMEGPAFREFTDKILAVIHSNDPS